ncbi:uncharacterized protein LOC130982803 [Arachis stenosperma]|uniref:uncharacterized protein LOC130982803 n=1 Tax=Arachis stenosperma TaxID=217475 RepID=UPI0025AC7559|nr:uncharacterized protein LOC130982803 [Arachis stenosperma]
MNWQQLRSGLPPDRFKRNGVVFGKFGLLPLLLPSCSKSSTPVRCHRSQLLPRARRPSSLSVQPRFRRRLFAVHVRVFVRVLRCSSLLGVHRSRSLADHRSGSHSRSSGSHVALLQTLRPTRALNLAVELLSFVAANLACSTQGTTAQHSLSLPHLRARPSSHQRRAVSVTSVQLLDCSRRRRRLEPQRLQLPSCSSPPSSPDSPPVSVAHLCSTVAGVSRLHLSVAVKHSRQDRLLPPS